MNKIITVVPNICEGKDKDFISKIEEKLKNVENLVVLNISMDNIRNRTVFSFTGSDKAIISGGMILYEESLKYIDMREHKGEYPRIGAVDVFPFVPIEGATIEEAIALSNKFAQKVAKEFEIPVYLYGESAKKSMRKELENIREREYEGLKEKLKDPVWYPDYGPAEFKPDFGATAIGARFPLLSFKIFLDIIDISILKKIGKSIDYQSGGLGFVKTYAGISNYNNMGQITVSISNYKKTPMYKVIEMLRLEAKRYGLEIKNVEMIGLIPEIVFVQSAEYYMNITGFSYDRLLEKNIQSHLGRKLSFFD